MGVKSVDIFPWNDHFNTGLPEVDMQHRVLVRLLNQMAGHLAFATGIPDLNRILDELTDYTAYHFGTEESIWEEHLSDAKEKALHKQWHQDFINTIRHLKAEQHSRPFGQIVDETLAYLARWLATHILEQDRYCALVVQAIQAGLPPDAARQRADDEMRGATRVLVDLLLSSYATLSANTVSLLREIAERKRIEASLNESEERFRLVVEQSPVGIMINRDKKTMDANDACLKMFGYASKAEIRGVPVFDHIAPQYRADAIVRYQRRNPGQDGDDRYETVGRRKDGSEFPLVISPRTIQLRGGVVTAAFMLDISDRKRAEQMEKNLNRTIKLISRCNALTVRATSEQELLSGVCRLAVEVGGHAMAWVGFAQDDADKAVLPVAHFGLDLGYLEIANISWGDTARGQGPTGSAIRIGKCVVVQDIQNSPAMQLWLEAARKRGFMASIALPLQVEEKIIGALTIYSNSAQAFGPEEVQLLEELSHDLAFGIQTMRLRAAKDAALRELEASERKLLTILDNVDAYIYLKDAAGRYLFANRQVRELWRTGMQDIVGSGDEKFYDAATAARIREDDRRVLREGKVFREEESLVIPATGQPATFQTVKLPMYGANGEIYALCGISMDVTESRRIRTQLEQTTRELRNLLANFDSTLEAERSHIAREVHDELGQILTSLGFAISTIRVKYGKQDSELLETVREMSALNERALQVTRNVAENLRPAVLDMGIVAAIEWLCSKTRTQTGIRCEFRATRNLDDMDQAQVAAVFRIAQESLTNAIRHADASRASISLSLHEDGLHLTVMDNGKGFEADGSGPRKSFGLLGMEERVRGMGGSFRLTSAPDEGTTVSVHMPYRRREAAP